MNTKCQLCQGNRLMLHNFPKPVLNVSGMKKKDRTFFMQWRKLTDNVSYSVQGLCFTVLLLCICYLGSCYREAALSKINYQATSVLHTVYIFNVLADQCSRSLPSGVLLLQCPLFHGKTNAFSVFLDLHSLLAANKPAKTQINKQVKCEGRS